MGLSVADQGGFQAALRPGVPGYTPFSPDGRYLLLDLTTRR